jgi:hypothetical protein
MQDAAPRLTRRNLIKTGLFGALVVGLGSVGLALQKTASRGDTPGDLKVLDATEFAVLAAMAERICPALGPGAPGATKLEVAHKADAMMESFDPESQKGIKIALRVFENALMGALMGERAVPFTQLSAEQQDRVLEGWRTSDVGFRRTIYRAVASLVTSAYWGSPETWARIGYALPNPAHLRAAYADQLVDLDSLRAVHASKEL